MKLIVIIRNNNVVAVVEKPNEVLSDNAVALLWAKSDGYERFPTDCRWESCELTNFGSVTLKLMPYSEQRELESEAAVAANNESWNQKRRWQQ